MVLVFNALNIFSIAGKYIIVKRKILSNERERRATKMY